MRAVTLERRRRFGSPPPAVARIGDHTIPGPDGDVPIQVYLPDAPGPVAILVFYHGGGWSVAASRRTRGSAEPWPT